MKFYSYCLVAFLLVSSSLTAQKKNITLNDIWHDGTFHQERLAALRSLDNGKEYAVMNFNRDNHEVTVDAYSYETGEKIQTLISTAEIPGLRYFQSYEFNQDETKALLATQVEPIYRRSSRAIYYVYDLEKEKLQQVSDQKIQEPSFSPDGSKVAYSFANNLYIKNLTNGEVTQLTDDGQRNKIINGTTDWVYEEEFAFTQAYQWNNDGSKIAFLRFDESEVPMITMEFYGTYPNQLYPEPYSYKYPKAGENNSVVTLHLYDVKSGELTKVDLKNDYEYIPRIKWTAKTDVLSAQLMNRHQDDMKLVFVNAEKNTTHVVLHETAEAYINVTDNLTFLADNSFLWTSERDNWNHIYHYAENGDVIDQVTSGDWVVSAFYGYDPASNRVFYQSTENGSVNRGVFSIKLNGRSKRQLSQKTGTNSADFSANYKYFINTFNDLNTPNLYTVNKASNGKLVRVIEDNHDLKETVAQYNIAPKEISTIQINGNELNMWMIKPPNFDPDEEYPMLMYQYSGPGSQSVKNTFFGSNDYWYEMLAQEGYIVVCVDGRGTGFKGADFKKMTQLELGKYEVIDQIAAAKKLSKRPYIDEERTGIWGWSYGGFMASNCIFQGADTFEMAIAVAPVTSWRFYDSVYTERYMHTPQENPEGYDKNSPITHVDELEGAFLLVHGSGDDNVHVQNSMQMIEALIQAGKQFDWAIYPDNNHGIYGGNTRYHLYTKMTNFIKENL